MTSDDDVGTQVVKTAINLSIQKATYFVQEFDDELKKSPAALLECSRWCHQLHDASRNTLEAVRDHLPLSSKTTRIVGQYRTQMGKFVQFSDKMLGVSCRRVVTPPSDATDVEKRVKSVVQKTEELTEELQILFDALSQ